MTIGEPDVRLHQVSPPAGGGARPPAPARSGSGGCARTGGDDTVGTGFRGGCYCRNRRHGDDEFDKWKKALEKTVKVEIDEEAWARLYKHISHPITYKKGKKIA